MSFPEGYLGKLRGDCVVATSAAVVFERNFRLALFYGIWLCVQQSNDNIKEGNKWTLLVV